MYIGCQEIFFIMTIFYCLFSTSYFLANECHTTITVVIQCIVFYNYIVTIIIILLISKYRQSYLESVLGLEHFPSCVATVLSCHGSGLLRDFDPL